MWYGFANVLPKFCHLKICSALLLVHLQFYQRYPGLPLPSHLRQLLWGDTNAFPSYPKDTTCPGSALAFFSVEQKQLHSEPLLDV